MKGASCQHKNTKKLLQKMKGIITWTYCSRCKEKVIYEGEEWKPQKSQIKTLCEKCHKIYEYTLVEMEEYPKNFWECECGGETEIIMEVSLGVVNE